MNSRVINSLMTMTSLEVAELTGKNHDHVLSDVRKMLAENGSPEKSAYLPDAYGKPVQVILLDEDQSIRLVFEYGKEHRVAIIMRWINALETQGKYESRSSV